MPITRLPVIYKFGIFSSNKRLELQERLRKQSLDAGSGKKVKPVNKRITTQVTEEFIQLFNSAVSLKDKDKYETAAIKLLERAKRRSGASNCGLGSHVNLPLAWTELAQLAQCKGQVQEASLDILITSLQVSTLEKCHIPALFFLAETMLYWLRMEEALDPYIRTREIKLLKMGQLVFERLFYYHMTGELQEFGDCKRRLCTYTEGIEELHHAYDIYPNALLYLKFITEVGKIILADSLLGSVNVDREETLPTFNQSDEEICLNIKTSEHNSRSEIRSSNSRALSSSVHDLSPTLWHALDVFRCTNSLSGGLDDALRSLARCGSRLAKETWIDAIVALQILGESAKTNMEAMTVLLNLAQGHESADDAETVQPLSCRIEFSDFSTICSQKEETDTNLCEQNLVPPGNSYDTKVSEIKTIFEVQQKTGTTARDRQQRIALAADNDISANRENQIKEEGNVENRCTSGQMHRVPGIQGWYWEVAYIFTKILENIVLYGSTAGIQKLALVGFGSGEDVPNQEYNMSSCGLVNLAFFNLGNKNNMKHLNTCGWSWRIRFGALQSLMRICESLKGDIFHDGLRTTAWNMLLLAKSKEKDCRVLEAFRVAKIYINNKNLLKSSMNDLPFSLEKHLATNLSNIYLPPIPLPAAATARAKLPVWSSPLTNMPVRPSEAKPLRTTIKQELILATGLHDQAADYYTRKSFDLRRIVEDQWRKELHAKMEESEKEEFALLQEKRQKEDERLKQIKALKLEKLHKKSLPPFSDHKRPQIKQVS